MMYYQVIAWAYDVLLGNSMGLYDVWKWVHLYCDLTVWFWHTVDIGQKLLHALVMTESCAP